MRTVFHYVFWGVIAGAAPGVLAIARSGSLSAFADELLYTILACLGAILGAVIGSTRAILSGYANRHDLLEHATHGFWADIFSMWSPPVGHAQRDWRHRMEFRRYQIYQWSMVTTIVALGCVLAYALMRE